MKNRTDHNLTKLSWLLLICAAFPFISMGQTNLTIETAIKIEFPTEDTNAYMLEQSTNLVDWTNSWQNWSAGRGYPISRFYELTGQKLFYRVQAIPRPEVIASTIPENGDTTVDPTVTNLTINFSSDMQTNGSMSVSTDMLRLKGENPIAPGYFNRSWVDARTYTLALALQSNTQYYAEFVFSSIEGIPTMPYEVTFKTQ